MSNLKNFGALHKFIDLVCAPHMHNIPKGRIAHLFKKFSTTSLSHNTVDVKEVEKFSKLAMDWWNPNSKFKPLFSMNSLRVPFIRDGLLQTSSGRKSKNSKPLENFNILDVGCGGGFLSEPLARLGANVLGIDPNQDCIEVAIQHASSDDNLKDRLQFKCCTVEDLVQNNDIFDAVVCSEVIEHVNNPKVFVECCSKLVKQKGSLFFTTIDKTFASYIGAIIFAEYIANFVPRGTHVWNKFIPSTNLQNMLESVGCQVQVIHGMTYNPITNKWTWVPWTNICYAMSATKI